jgi:hypothetical protein
MKPDCYNCKWRGTVPGSAHSSCKVISSNVSEDSKAMQLEIMLATHQVQLTNKETNEPLVKLNETGIRGGWASWPLDFDPIWIESCVFEKKENGTS